MTRTRKETRTIQTWPSGKSFEYRGDPDGPANQKSLRAGHYAAHQRCTADCWALRWSDGAAVLPGHGVVPGVSRGDDRVGRNCIVREVPGGVAGFVVEICPMCKGEGYTPNPEKNPWRKGTDDEWRTIRIALRAELYQRNYIHRNLTALVTDLMEAANSGELRGDLAEGFGYDEIRGLYKDPSDWTLEQCRDYVRDLGDDRDVDAPNPWRMEREALAEQLSAVGIEVREEESAETLREAVIVNIDDETIAGLDEWRTAARELAQDNPAEVYEWYLVDSWLCDQLHAIGEVTIDNGYGHFWGRTCTGQMLIMDGTLQEVAARYETLD